MGACDLFRPPFVYRGMHTSTTSLDKPSDRDARDRWRALYRANVGMMLRLAYLLTGDAEMSRDIVQDAFVRLFARFGERGSPEALTAYLRRTVVNLSRDHWRRVGVRRNYLLREVGAPVATEPPTSQVDARDQIWRALRRLPHAQRATIVLRYYEDLTEQQIADAMKCSLGAVKSRLSRGMSALRKNMAGDEL
jgi:RNA polymerase sigma-70 factor (sigma-E family)